MNKRKKERKELPGLPFKRVETESEKISAVFPFMLPLEADQA